MASDPYKNDPHASTPFPPVFLALRTLARDRGLYVAVHLWFGRREPRAEFVTKDGVRVMLRTRRGPNAVHDVVDSMILAHEMGHHTSHVRKEPSPALEALLTDAPEEAYRKAHELPRALREEWIAEEIRAWNYAREDLTRVGFTNWRTFDRWAPLAVGSYVRALKLQTSTA